MNRNLAARCIAVVLLGILFGYYIDYDQRKTRQMGKEQHLASEARKFDELIANPTPRAAMIFGGIIVLGAFVCLYEVIVLGLGVALKSKALTGKSATGNPNLPFS